MKIVPKAQYGRSLVALSDNTRVAKPVIERKIEYKLKPGEFFFTDRNTGKKTLIKPKNETISTDRRTIYQRKLDEKRIQQLHRLYEEDKKLEEGMRNLLGFLTFVSPSTYIGPVLNNNGKSYALNVMSGEGTGSTAGNVAIDILTPFAVGGARSLAANAVKRFPYRLSIPHNPNRYYRIVGSPTAKAGDAIADANNTGFLRSSSLASSAEPIDKGAISLRPKTFDYLMFSKGKPWTGSTNGAGFGGHLNNGLRVIVSKANTGPISWEESNVDFRHKGHAGIFRPNYNGSLEQIPANYFEYYERGTGPITRHLWKKRLFKSPTISQLSNSSAISNNSSVSSDALNLHFLRLKNGGYDKLEKLLQDYMVNNPLSSGFLHFRDNGRIGEMPFVRKNLRDLVSIETPLNPNSIFTEQDLENAGGAIAFTSQGMIEYSPEALLKNGYDISRSLSHEVDHALHIPLEKPQGFDLSKLSKEDQLYFTKFHGSELSARGSQIKDWLKFNRADLNITENDLKNAALNYINDTGMNNKMTLFFNSISDYKKAAEWLSKYSTGLSIPIILNKNE